MPELLAPPQLSVPHAAHLFQLLADPSRLRMLYLLLDRGELPVNAVCEELGLTQTNVSKQLGYLRHAHLVEYRREGRQNFYRVSSDLVVTLLQRAGGDWE